MLQSVIKNKLNRYLVREGGPPEDLITDCFFGPFRYLDGRDVGRVLDWICKNSGPGRDYDLAGLVVDDIELWPRSSGVEPDALIRCSMADGSKLRFVVEVKWNAGLGEEQALRQWQLFSDQETGRLLHLIVCRQRTSIERDIAAQEKRWGGSTNDLRLWQESRIVLTWHDVATRLRDMTGARSAQLQRWTRDVRALLRKYGERPFDGFTCPASLMLQPPLAVPIFWAREMTFNWPQTHVEPQQGAVFWQGEMEQ